MANNYDSSDGVWRTIGGRRVFIRNGQSLGDAMKESGKFKNLKNSEPKKEVKLTVAEEDALAGLDALLALDGEKFDSPEDLARQMVFERNNRIGDFEAELDRMEEEGHNVSMYKEEGWDEEVNYDEVLEKIKQNPERFEKYLTNEAVQNGNNVTREEIKAKQEVENNKWLDNESNNWLKEQKHDEKLDNKIKNFKPSGDIEDDERRLNDIATNYFYDEVGVYNENIDSTATKWAHDKAVELNEANATEGKGKKYTADEQDILDRYGEDYGYDNSKSNIENLKSQIDYMRNPNESINQTAQRLVEGGDFLIYNGDIKEWLDERGIKYNDDNFFDKYKKEMADKIEHLYYDDKTYNLGDKFTKKENGIIETVEVTGIPAKGSPGYSLRTEREVDGLPNTRGGYNDSAVTLENLNSRLDGFEKKYKTNDEAIYNGKRVRIEGIDHDDYGEDYFIGDIEKLKSSGNNDFKKWAKDNNVDYKDYTDYVENRSSINPSKYNNMEDYDKAVREEYLKHNRPKSMNDKIRDGAKKSKTPYDVFTPEQMAKANNMSVADFLDDIGLGEYKNEYLQYKKEHPNSKMTINQFANKVKNKK